MLYGQEDERRRVARELHDEVGQSLTALMLAIDGVAETAGPETQPRLAELRETARALNVELERSSLVYVPMLSMTLVCAVPSCC